MKQKPISILLGGIFLCGILAAVYYVGSRLLQNGYPPSVLFVSPQSAFMLDPGEGAAIVIEARADAGVERLTLFVDGDLYAEESASGAESLRVVFPWYATALGSHTLEAVAYDTVNRASEPAQLLAGVQANLEPNGIDYVYIPPAGPVGADGQPAEGQVVPLDIQASVDGSANPPPVDESPDEPISEEILGEPLTPEEALALPNASDAPPTISAFSAEPRRNGQQVQIAYRVEAQDDLGIDRLEFSAQNTTTGESSYKTSLCFGDAVCALDDVYPLTASGVWLVGVHAVDTSGQSSGPHIVAVEIVENGNLNPAVAVLDLAAARPQIADNLLDEPVGIPLDLNSVDPNIVIDNAVTAQNSCMQAVVEPRAGGHFISAVYLCEEERPTGYDLNWKIVASTAQVGGASHQSVTVLDRFYEDRTALSPGDNFSTLYETPFCGTASNYRIFVYWWPESRPLFGQPTGSGGSILDVRNVPGADCRDSSLIRDLRADAAPEGVTLTWTFAQTADFPAGLWYLVYRSDPNDPAGGREVFRGSMDAASLSQGGIPASFFDESPQCGFTPYDYSVVVLREIPQPSDIVTARVDRVPCLTGSIGNLPLDLAPGYTRIEEVNGETLSLPVYSSAITTHSVVPPNFPFPAGANLELRLMTRSIGDSPDLQAEPLPGNPTEIRITDEIRANGFTFDSTALVKCSATHHQWAYAWELLSDGQPLETGPIFTVNSPPCLPGPEAAPDFISIRGTDDPAVCGARPYCVILSWGPLPAPDTTVSQETLLRVDGLAIFRSLASRESDDAEAVPNLFSRIPVSRTEFVDSRIECTSRAGEISYRYNIYVTAQGVYNSHGYTTAFIETPACGQPYNVTGTILR